jgi:hypothetical protein
VGYDLRDDASRVRSFQYLGGDPDEATLRHIKLTREWDAIKQEWPKIKDDVRTTLPPLLEHANLSKPIWIKPEWRAEAKIDSATAMVSVVERFKRELRQTTSAGLPADIQACVLQAVAPTANESIGKAIDAKPFTIREAADAFYLYKAEKIGLHIPGLKRGGGLNALTYNGLKRELEYALDLLDESADLRTLAHDTLEKFRDDAYREAKKPRTAWNRVKALKSLLDWAHRNQNISYRSIDTIDEIFGLARPDTTRRTSYGTETAAKLIAIREQSAAGISKGAEPVWPFVLLALNAGAYQIDLSSLTCDNIKVDAKGKRYLWWQRRKTRHQNENLWTRHDLWPETWAAMEAVLAQDDPTSNPSRLLFLNSAGRPLYHTAKDKARGDVIGLRFKRTCSKGKDAEGKDAPVDLPFMQLRKISLNAIKKASGGSDDCTRKFAGQRVPGVLRAYLEDEFSDVSEALAKWRGDLIKDGVLCDR